ncbi:MAG: AraC family transcriptional regulator [Anaerolineaceae bacterium]|nr:AraC family transcriptional regulator [Anaerolineaceae bacterium]
MEPLKQLNLAMRYIEDNLAGVIDFEQLSGLAGYSEYHFRRMFSLLSGLSLGEYIRRRRLAQAALELQISDIKIIDLAIRYGYDSSDSFSRAFQGLHGVTPTTARKRGTALKAFPPMAFQLTIQGGFEMDYRIVEKEAFSIVGIKKRVSLRYNGINPEIAAMWASLTEENIKKLKQLSNVEPMGLISASVNFTEGREEGGKLDQYIGVATKAGYFDEWEVLAVPATTWAVFSAIGSFPEALQNIWGRIYSEWFAISGYELAQGPEILWNEHKDITQPNFRSEIWIPVIKK